MIGNTEVMQMGVDTVQWCDEQMKKAIDEGKQLEAAAYARLKHLWEERTNGKSKEPNNG